MRKSRNVKSLLAELDRREAEIADIEARVVNLHSRYQSVWSALSNDRPLSGATKPTKRKKRQPRSLGTMGLGPKDVDLTGAKTSFEKLVRIAEVAPNNEVNLTQAINLMIALGTIPPSKFHSTRTTLHNAVKKRENGFKRLRPGWYRYVPSKVGQLPPVQWRDGEIDYAGCTNIGQRLVRMAKITADGKLEPEQAAQRLIQDGESSQRADSLARLVRQSLRRLSHFRELEDDWFELSDFSSLSASETLLQQVADIEPGTIPSRGVSDPRSMTSGSMNGNSLEHSQESIS